MVFKESIPESLLCIVRTATGFDKRRAEIRWSGCAVPDAVSTAPRTASISRRRRRRSRIGRRSVGWARHALSTRPRTRSGRIPLVRAGRLSRRLTHGGECGDLDARLERHTRRSTVIPLEPAAGLPALRGQVQLVEVGDDFIPRVDAMSAPGDQRRGLPRAFAPHRGHPKQLRGTRRLQQRSRFGAQLTPDVSDQGLRGQAVGRRTAHGRGIKVPLSDARSGPSPEPFVETRPGPCHRAGFEPPTTRRSFTRGGRRHGEITRGRPEPTASTAVPSLWVERLSMERSSRRLRRSSSVSVNPRRCARSRRTRKVAGRACGARHYSSMRSTIVAMPWPTPMHIVARP